MKHRITAALVAAVLALTMAGAAFAVEEPSPPEDGEVVRVIDVIDGDTIRVEWPDGWWERVRYIGIDTPEIGHDPGEADEPWGREATEVNADLVDGRDVLLEFDVSDTDRYDRLLRYVWVESGGDWVMANGELVARGLADVRAYEPDTKHDAWFRQLQDEARAAGLGMYGDGDADDGDAGDGDTGDEAAEPGLLERFLDLIDGD